MKTRNCEVGTTDEKKYKYKVEEYQKWRANKKKKIPSIFLLPTVLLFNKKNATNKNTIILKSHKTRMNFVVPFH